MGYSYKDFKDIVDAKKHQHAYFLKFGKGRFIIRILGVILFAVVLGLIYGRFVVFMDRAYDYESGRYSGDWTGRIISTLPVVKGNVKVTAESKLKLGQKVSVGEYSLQVVGGKIEGQDYAPGEEIGVVVPGATEDTGGEYGLKQLREKRKSYWKRRQERRERRETMGVWQEFSGVGSDIKEGEEEAKEEDPAKIKLPGEYDREEWGK